jgi:DNA-binding GntR family transcriptional regulator
MTDQERSELAAEGGQNSELAYMKIVDDVAKRIISKELPPGTRLRSERDLADHYAVSYGTVRRAFKELRTRGLVVSVQGRGNFVA